MDSLRVLMALGVILALAGWAPAPAEAQTNYLYDFHVAVEDSAIVIPNEAGNGRGFLRGTVEDRSKDPPYPLLPDGVPTVPVVKHNVAINVEAEENLAGWVLGAPSSSDTGTFPGDTLTFEMVVQFDAQATIAYNRFWLNVTISTQDGSTFEYPFQIVAIAQGLPTFTALGTGSATLAPDATTSFSYQIINLAFDRREFTIEVVDNPCNLGIVKDDRVAVDGRQSPGRGLEAGTFGVQAPQGVYLFGSQCLLKMGFASVENPNLQFTASYTVTLQGYGPPFSAYLWTFFFLLILLVLLLVFRRSRERLNSRILGKPEKPWLIPVEAVYLKALKRKDPQAWHVVRHHLMEDEYRSSMLWFEAYKKATKGSRKKERVILRHEDKFTKWKAKWAKRIAAPLLAADKREAKLQRKLDRKARKAHRKARKAWRADAKKAGAKADKAYAKAVKRHAKAAAKAKRKGLPEPAAPQRPVLDDGAEPALVPILLSDHRWSKKAARFRRRRVREQGNLEVKFEKQEARYLAKLRRRVQRLARRLDDPEFVHEHPLLADG